MILTKNYLIICALYNITEINLMIAPLTRKTRNHDTSLYRPSSTTLLCTIEQIQISKSFHIINNEWSIAHIILNITIIT